MGAAQLGEILTERERWLGGGGAVHLFKTTKERRKCFLSHINIMSVVSIFATKIQINT